MSTVIVSTSTVTVSIKENVNFASFEEINIPAGGEHWNDVYVRMIPVDRLTGVFFGERIIARGFLEFEFRTDTRGYYVCAHFNFFLQIFKKLLYFSTISSTYGFIVQTS